MDKEREQTGGGDAVPASNDLNSSLQSSPPPLPAPAQQHGTLSKHSQSLHTGHELQHSPRHTHQWPPPVPYHRHQMIQDNNTIDGFRATTLVGVGGLVGWTAAAAYRWLNGGEFSMFPPPPTQPSLNNNGEAFGSPRTTTSPPFPGRGHVLSNPAASASDHRYHDNIQGNRHQQQHDHQIGNDPDQLKLAEQVKDLVDALKQQSTENREIVKQLSQHRDTQQTNDSIRRLREQSSDNNNSRNGIASSAAAAAASMAVFCKLNDIQTELSGLRRDIKSLPDDDGLEKWEERLSSALENVQSCLSNMNTPTQEETIKAKNNGISPSTAIDATPIRAKTAAWSDETPPEPSEPDKASSGKESGIHAVARALRKLVLENDAVPLRVGCQLLYLYAINLASHPSIPRYRKIFTTNESFQKVDNLNGGRDILHAVGFQEKDNSLVWQPNDGEEEIYLPLLNEVVTALGILKSSGHASVEDLLERALACLSLGPPSLTPNVASTPSAFAVGGTNAGDNNNNNNHLPAALKTPDPSVLSPPITKKQVVMPTDATDDGGVSFSPPRLDSFTESAADCSFFTNGTDNNSSKDSQTQELDQLADADSMWK